MGRKQWETIKKDEFVSNSLITEGQGFQGLMGTMSLTLAIIAQYSCKYFTVWTKMSKVGILPITIIIFFTDYF